MPLAGRNIKKYVITETHSCIMQKSPGIIESRSLYKSCRAAAAARQELNKFDIMSTTTQM